MDFALSEEQQLLKSTARGFLEKKCPRTLVRELIETPDGFSRDLWQEIVAMGWLGLPFDEQHGGASGSFLDLAVILEESGRALLPGPFFSTVLLGAYPVSDAGSAGQRAAILPRVAEGNLILTMAMLETGAAYDPADIGLSAKLERDAYLLRGTKLFVPDANLADLILTVVRTSPGDDNAGISILLVDRRDPGVRCAPLKPIDGSKLFEVTFEDVRVPRENVLGEPDGAMSLLDRTLARAGVGECLRMIGGAQVAVDMSIEHVKSRVQFGQPVGSFQAVQHHCANMASDLDGARLMTYKAAWMLSEGLPCAKEVAIAKAWVNDACHRVVSLAHQVHGGSGFITEHDLTLYFKRTKAAEIAFGSSGFHYRALAQALGL